MSRIRNHINKMKLSINLCLKKIVEIDFCYNQLYATERLHLLLTPGVPELELEILLPDCVLLAVMVQPHRTLPVRRVRKAIAHKPPEKLCIQQLHF